MSSIVGQYIEKVEERLAGLDSAALARVEESSTLDHEELFTAQQTQSALFAAGIIPQDLAQWVYRVAGGETISPAEFAKQPLAVRVTFIKLFQELLEIKMKMQQTGVARRAVA